MELNTSVEEEEEEIVAMEKNQGIKNVLPGSTLPTLPAQPVKTKNPTLKAHFTPNIKRRLTKQVSIYKIVNQSRTILNNLNI